MKLKGLTLLAIALFALSACGGAGIDLSKLSACGECVEGSNDLATAQSMQESMKSLNLPK
ncbi:exported hypothetical protein [uncultured Thiomicrorhabdus sp.]